MTSAEDWSAMVPELQTWATVRVLGPGRLELSALDEPGTTRELRITPDEWDCIDGVIYGGHPPSAAAHIRRAWDRATDEDHFLVYDGQYDVQPSHTSALPPDREWEEAMNRVAETLRKNPDADFGWFAHPPNVDSQGT